VGQLLKAVNINRGTNGAIILFRLQLQLQLNAVAVFTCWR
jgi:hypothetical protein